MYVETLGVMKAMLVALEDISINIRIVIPFTTQSRYKIYNIKMIGAFESIR